MTFKTHFIELPEGKEKTRKISYTEWGDSGNNNVLFCVHGLSRNARDFDYIAEALSSNYRVVCMDVAGRGESDWLENKSKYNYQTYISDVYALLDSLQIDRVDWLGTSMGGIIGMIIASKRPEIINRLILNDVGAFIPGVALDRIMGYVGVVPLFSSRNEASQTLRHRMATFGVKDDSHWQHIFKHSIKKRKDGKYSFVYDPKIAQKPGLLSRVFFNLKNPNNLFKMPNIDLWSVWEKIQAPVFVIRGEFSDILTKDILIKMKESKPELEYAEISAVGHAPTLMDSKQIETVRNWLVKDAA